MKSTIAKTITLIVFVVFLGINDVEAKTCQYWKTDNKDKTTDTITITISADGKEVSAVYADLHNFRDMEVGFSIEKGCPKSVKVTGDYIYEGGKYFLNGDDSSVQTFTPIDGDELVKCGEIEDIPGALPRVTSIIYILIQVLVPVVLVILGMLDLTKGVMSQKEDEIKKGQQVLIKRLITAAIVFFVFALIKMFTSFFADDSSVGECLNCFIKGECESSGPVDAEMEWKK